MVYPIYTRDQIKAMLDAGCVITPAYLYEPDHAPKGTKFIFWEGRGLYRVRVEKPITTDGAS